MSTFDSRRVAPHRAGDDSGFTIVEILMAMVILLIAFTGVMSLMMANTYMNVRAKEKASLVNEANSYIERVRQMPYADIGTATSTPPGALAPYTTTVSGYTIDVVPSVTPITDPEIVSGGTPTPGLLKRLQVSLIARRPGSTSPAMTYHAETVIKLTDSGLNESAELPSIDPSGSSQATDGAVVYGDNWEIGATAAAVGEGVVLTSMNFYCDGVALMDRSGGLAQWTLSSATDSRTFRWDTTAINEDGVPLSSDGGHTIRVEVWDSNGRQSWYQWNVIVDNTPPVWPADGWMTANAVSGRRIDLAWTEVFDGTAPTDHYSVDAEKSVGAVWVPLGATIFRPPYGNYAAEPFTRYQFRVTALGPPSLNRPSQTSTWTACTTRPELAGTWRTAGDNKNMAQYVTLTLTPPTFPYNTFTTYSSVWKSTSPSMTNTSTVETPVRSSTLSTPREFTVQVLTGNGWPAATQYYYQAVTKIGTVLYYSQVVGPSGTGSGAPTTSGTLATVRW